MAAAAAPEAPVEGEGEEKKKGPLVKIIVMVLVVLILIGGSVAGTLFATGFFSKKNKAEEAIDAQLDKLDAAEGHGAPADGHEAPKADAHGAPADSHGKPGAEPPTKELVSNDADNQRWKFNYYTLEKPLLSNLTGSRKVMQVQVTIMTHYDDRVIKNIKTHELPIRAAMLDVMRLNTEADINQADFRKALAENLRLTINSLLEKYEGFGGVEEVSFTEFVVQ
ncbi:MAG: flagellar basal body-associated FliL family protein [Burkholderiales bacterium]|jgi:flagellar FliL protein|nr:flagellar basal body-associated FliL family protein [Burkholderiales bacterium]